MSRSASHRFSDGDTPPAQSGAADIPLRRARIDLDGYPIALETNSPAAVAYLEAIEIPSLSSHSFRVSSDDVPAGAFSLRYLDAPEFSASFDERAASMTLTAPFDRISESMLLKNILWLLANYQRQNHGQFAMHAAAVARDDRCIVFVGPSGSGKSTLALELCLHHGFELIANDHLIAGMTGTAPVTVEGDAFFRLPMSSLAEYSPPLAARFFGDLSVPPEEARQKKVRISPEELGVRTATGHRPITHYVMPTLVRDGELRCHDVPGGVDRGTTISIKHELYDRLSRVLRGKITPLDNQLAYVNLFVPSLDTANIVAKRTTFLESLFSEAHAVRVRGTLGDIVDWLVTADHRVRAARPSPR
jgi:hypothetical protein